MRIMICGALPGAFRYAACCDHERYESAWPCGPAQLFEVPLLPLGPRYYPAEQVSEANMRFHRG